MKKQLRRRKLEFVPIVLIGLVLLIFILAGRDQYDILKNRLTDIQGPWLLNGETADDLPLKDHQTPGEITKLEIALDSSFNGGQAVCFYTSYQEVDAYLDGVNIYSFHKPAKEIITRAAPSVWNTVYLPEDCEGSVLSIELSSPYKKYSNQIPEFYAGDPHQVSRFISMKTVPEFVASLGVLAVGLILSLIAVNVRQHIQGQTGLYSLGLFIVALATFLTSQQTGILINLYDGVSYIFIQHISMMLCPVLYSWYMMRTGKGFMRKV